MKTDLKIIKEIQKYHKINKYLMEQDVPPAGDIAIPPPPDAAGLPAPDAPPAPGAPAAPPDAPGATPAATTPQVIDVEADKDVEKIDNKGKKEGSESDIEEIDITELIDSQQNIESKQEEYFDNLFKQLEGLQSKLSVMDSLVGKLNSIETKLEKYREKTPEERLELRTLDSGPYNQKLSDFFSEKQGEMEKSGKNEYVLTTDDVTDFSPNEIKKTFTAELPSMTTKNYN